MNDAGAPIVRLHQVSMRYGTVDVLRGVDLELRTGSFAFLVGPSGAGKTSLLRVLSLTHPPAAGSIALFGRDVAKLRPDEALGLRRRIGVIFQELRLLDHMSAFENVALPLRLAGAAEAQIGGYVSELMEWLGLAGVMESRPPALSMGQRQLVAAARAVVARPGLVLADEPTSNLDPDKTARLMHLLEQLHRLGTVVVLATHSRELLRRHPHPVLRMEAGRLAAPAPRPQAA